MRNDQQACFYSFLVLSFPCKCSCILIRFLSSKLSGFLSGVCKDVKNRSPTRLKRGSLRSQIEFLTSEHATTHTHTSLLITSVLVNTASISLSYVNDTICVIFLQFFFSPEAVLHSGFTSCALLCMRDVHVSAGVSALCPNKCASVCNLTHKDGHHLTFHAKPQGTEPPRSCDTTSAASCGDSFDE